MLLSSTETKTCKEKHIDIVNNNGLFDLAATDGLETQSTCILRMMAVWRSW